MNKKEKFNRVKEITEKQKAILEQCAKLRQGNEQQKASAEFGIEKYKELVQEADRLRNEIGLDKFLEMVNQLEETKLDDILDEATGRNDT